MAVCFLKIMSLRRRKAVINGMSDVCGLMNGRLLKHNIDTKLNNVAIFFYTSLHVFVLCYSQSTKSGNS